MDRRSFINRVAGALLAAPLGAEAQPAEKVYRVGFLATGTFIQTYRTRIGMPSCRVSARPATSKDRI